MMTDSDILDGLVAKANELLEKATRAQKGANEFAAAWDLPIPFPNVSTEPVVGSRVAIRPDQFGNETTPSGATRAYLELRGPNLGAASMEDIYEALHAGGFAFSSKNKAAAMGGLKVALGKDKSFRRFHNGTIGLWVWYPRGKRDDKAETEATGVAGDLTAENPKTEEEEVKKD